VINTSTVRTDNVGCRLLLLVIAHVSYSSFIVLFLCFVFCTLTRNTLISIILSFVVVFSVIQPSTSITTLISVYTYTDLARKIVMAEMQLITYNEFLPALLGTTGVGQAPTYEGWNFRPDDAAGAADPRLSHEFATVFFRLGHSMLSSNFELRASNGEIVNLPLSDTFFLPQLLKDMPELVDSTLRGLMYSEAQNIDTFVITEVRDLLFTLDGVTTRCMDLPALNIQRGRDHGIPDYNTLRRALGLSTKSTFRDITGELDTSKPSPFADALAAAYNNDITNVDPYVGMLSEPHLPGGAAVGELLATGLIEQFTNLRDGDPLFSKCDPDLQQFRGQTHEHIVDLNRLTLASVIARNTNVDVDPTVNIFRLGMPPSNFGGGDNIFSGCNKNGGRQGGGGGGDGGGSGGGGGDQPRGGGGGGDGDGGPRDGGGGGTPRGGGGGGDGRNPRHE
jgi:Animal haem peroxidase